VNLRRRDPPPVLAAMLDEAGSGWLTLEAFDAGRGADAYIEIGRLMHDRRPTPPRGAERHASSDGVDALKRLEARGLVERVERGKWRARIVEGWA
jgi:hypothetical protein